MKRLGDTFSGIVVFISILDCTDGNDIGRNAIKEVFISRLVQQISVLTADNIAHG